MIRDEARSETDPLAMIWNDDEKFEQLAKEAVHDALREHKRKGESIAVWRDGKVVTLTADEIPDFPVGTPPPTSKSG